MDGQGEYLYADGNEYTGEWQGDLKHGQGAIKYAGGSTYEVGSIVRRNDSEFLFVEPARSASLDFCSCLLSSYISSSAATLDRT